MAGIDGLSVGDAVTAEQMRSLFGVVLRPLAIQRLEQLDAAELTDTSIKAATRRRHVVRACELRRLVDAPRPDPG